MSGAKWGLREMLSRAVMSRCLCRVFQGVMALFPKRCPLWRRMILCLCVAFSLHATANGSRRVTQWVTAAEKPQWLQRERRASCSDTITSTLHPMGKYEWEGAQNSSWLFDVCAQPDAPFHRLNVWFWARENTLWQAACSFSWTTLTVGK